MKPFNSLFFSQTNLSKYDTLNIIIKTNFAEHIFNTNHTYTNIETNLKILHILPKGPKCHQTILEVQTLQIIINQHTKRSITS